jgi:hypothetical protein
MWALSRALMCRLPTWRKRAPCSRVIGVQRTSPHAPPAGAAKLPPSRSAAPRGIKSTITTATITATTTTSGAAAAPAVRRCARLSGLPPTPSSTGAAKQLRNTPLPPPPRPPPGTPGPSTSSRSSSGGSVPNRRGRGRGSGARRGGKRSDPSISGSDSGDKAGDATSSPRKGWGRRLWMAALLLLLAVASVSTLAIASSYWACGGSCSSVQQPTGGGHSAAMPVPRSQQGAAGMCPLPGLLAAVGEGVGDKQRRLRRQAPPPIPAPAARLAVNTSSMRSAAGSQLAAVQGPAEELGMANPAAAYEGQMPKKQGLQQLAEAWPASQTHTNASSAAMSTPPSRQAAAQPSMVRERQGAQQLAAAWPAASKTDASTWSAATSTLPSSQACAQQSLPRQQALQATPPEAPVSAPAGQMAEVGPGAQSPALEQLLGWHRRAHQPEELVPSAGTCQPLETLLEALLSTGVNRAGSQASSGAAQLQHDCAATAAADAEAAADASSTGSASQQGPGYSATAIAAGVAAAALAIAAARLVLTADIERAPDWAAAAAGAAPRGATAEAGRGPAAQPAAAVWLAAVPGDMAVQTAAAAAGEVLPTEQQQQQQQRTPTPAAAGDLPSRAPSSRITGPALTLPAPAEAAAHAAAGPAAELQILLAAMETREWLLKQAPRQPPGAEAAREHPQESASSSPAQLSPPRQGAQSASLLQEVSTEAASALLLRFSCGHGEHVLLSQCLSARGADTSRGCPPGCFTTPSQA